GSGRPRCGGGPRCHRRFDRHAAEATAPIADVGSRRGNGAARSAAHQDRIACLLLRSASPVAARHPTKIRTACCANTSPRAPTCPDTLVASSKRLQPHSTVGREKHWVGKRLPRYFEIISARRHSEGSA